MDANKKGLCSKKDIAVIYQELKNQGIHIPVDASTGIIAEKVLRATTNLIHQRDLYSQIIDSAIHQYGQQDKLLLVDFACLPDVHCEITFEQTKHEDGTCHTIVSREVGYNETM